MNKLNITTITDVNIDDKFKHELKIKLPRKKKARNLQKTVKK